MRRTFALEDEVARLKLEEVAARSALADEVRARVSAEALQGYSRAEEVEEDDDDVVFSGGASARGGPGGAQRKTKVGKMDDDEDIVIMDDDDAPVPARGAGAGAGGGASKRQALDPDRALEGALERHANTVSRCQVCGGVEWGEVQMRCCSRLSFCCRLPRRASRGAATSLCRHVWLRSARSRCVRSGVGKGYQGVLLRLLPPYTPLPSHPAGVARVGPR